MRFAVEVLVTLKPGLADPQGKAVEGALPDARLDERVRRAGRQARAARAGGRLRVGGADAGRGDGRPAPLEPRDRGLADPGVREA